MQMFAVEEEEGEKIGPASVSSFHGQVAEHNGGQKSDSNRELFSFSTLP